MKKWILSLVALLGLATCTAVPGADDAGVGVVALEDCPPVITSIPMDQGDEITENLRDVWVSNGVVRLRYGARNLDFRDLGSYISNDERHMDHILEARHTDAPEVASTPGCLGDCHNGTHWHDAVYPWYGDGVTFSSSVLTRDADRIVILRADDDVVELSYQWDNVRLDTERSPGYCVFGYYPECGPTDRNSEGGAIYVSGNTVKSIKEVDVYKNIRVERCSPGYFVALRSDPPLKWEEQGPRSVRLGYVSTEVAWNCGGGSEVARHPSAGGHVSLGSGGCIADVPATRTGHEGWPFIRFMTTYSPTPMWSLQYDATQLGSPGANDLYDTTGADGRAYPWQAFVGAVEFGGSSADLNDLTTETATVMNAMPEFPN